MENGEGRAASGAHRGLPPARAALLQQIFEVQTRDVVEQAIPVVSGSSSRPVLYSVRVGWRSLRIMPKPRRKATAIKAASACCPSRRASTCESTAGLRRSNRCPRSGERALISFSTHASAWPGTTTSTGLRCRMRHVSAPVRDLNERGMSRNSSMRPNGQSSPATVRGHTANQCSAC